MALSNQEKEYYSRQLPIVKEEGQEKIKNKKVLIGGIGGIGSAAVMALTRLGVGKIKIVDNDKMERSNLNRQILYNENEIGKQKTEVAKKKLQEINPHVNITAVNKKITKNNIDQILDNQVDAFIDGLDNIKTRYLVNKKCIRDNIPYFHASCEGMEGRVTTIIPNQTPCLKCIYKGKKPKQKPITPVIGFIPNKLGIIEAEQFYRHILGLKTLKNKMMIFSSEKIEPSILKIEKNKDCEICGENK